MMHRGRSTRSLLIVLSLFVFAASANAQTQRSIGVVGGISQYDLSGTGDAPFGAVRFNLTPATARFVVLEAGLEFLTYKSDFSGRHNHFFPEVMIQLQLPSRSFRPYLGAGAGYSFSSNRSAFTLSGAAGFRIPLSSDWAVNGELRIRAVDPWIGTTADWGLGLFRSF